MGIIVDILIILIIAIFSILGYEKGLAKVLIKLLSFVVSIVIALVLYKPVSNVIIKNTQIDEKIKEKITVKILPESETENTISKSIIDTTNGVVDNASEQVTIKIIQTGTMIALFLIARIILLVVSMLSNVIDKIPVIKQFNKLGGTIYGILKGIFIVLIILAVTALVAPLLGENIISAITNSTIGGFIYNNNVILKIL